MFAWGADPVLPDFDAVTLAIDAEDDGPLAATLLRRRTELPSRRAVLYLHGYLDYFFQAHVADAFLAAGWDFYALDLRRYGRSLRPGNRPNYCTDLSAYDPEITAAIEIACDDDGHETLVLLGHSTGGLIASMYAHAGARRESISALVLNSPFFRFAIPGVRGLLIPVVGALGAALPWAADPTGLSPRYGESLLAAHHGEWTYDTRWKPVRGFPVYFGWVRAIRRAQARLVRGLDLTCPVLVLHSHASTPGIGPWREEFRTRDIVLDVADMRELGPRLGAQVTLHEVRDGLHDLFLSRRDVRDAATAATLAWLDAHTVSSPDSHDV